MLNIKVHPPSFQVLDDYFFMPNSCDLESPCTQMLRTGIWMIKIVLKCHETCFNLCFVAFDYDVHMLMDNCNSIYISFTKVKQE